MAPTLQVQSLWICPFKAHKGKPVEDIPRGYLEWLLEQSWFCDPANGRDRAIKAIQIELAYRERHGEVDDNDDDGISLNRRILFNLGIPCNENDDDENNDGK